MTSPYITIHRLFRRLQQKNRFIGVAKNIGLTLAETHFILELQADPARSIGDLAALLRLDQSSCSRIAQSLAKQGLVKVTPSELDSRKKVMLITSRGSTVIEKMDQFYNGALAGYSENVTARELNRLVKGLELIADGYGHAPGVRRPFESEYRVQQRRVTRCFGLLGDHVFESNFSSSQWQALSEIVLAPVPPRTNELAELLGLAPNSLSSVIDWLEKRRLIKRIKHPADKRILMLVPLSEGVRLAREIEERAARDLQVGLDRLDKQGVSEFIKILASFVGELNPIFPPLLPGYRIEELISAEQLQFGRGFAVRAIVENRQQDFVPELLVASAHRNFLLYAGEEPQCLLEYSVSEREVGVVFASWMPRVSPWIIIGALNRIELVLQSSRANKTALSDQIKFKPLKDTLCSMGTGPRSF